MQVLKSPFIFAHVENPMLFQFSKETSDAIIFNIAVQGKNNYFTAYPIYDPVNEVYIINFDLAPFLKPYFEDLSLMFMGYSFTIDSENTVVGYAVRGGISKRQFMQLMDMDSEIFSYRLLSAQRQYLLTTRTQENTINIRRGELRYVYFFRDPNNSITFTATGLTPQVYAADQFDLECFDVVQWMGATQVNQITITKATHTTIINIVDNTPENPILLMFRNSLGVFEHFQLTGKGASHPNITKDEYYKYNEDYGDFSKLNTRGLSNEYIEVETGYKNKEELMFIQDLLFSGEVYLITGTEELPCRVSSKDFKIPLVINTPQSVPIRIDPADEESHYTDLTPIQVGPVPPIVGDEVLMSPSGSIIFAYITV